MEMVRSRSKKLGGLKDEKISRIELVSASREEPAEAPFKYGKLEDKPDHSYVRCTTLFGFISLHDVTLTCALAFCCCMLVSMGHISPDLPVIAQISHARREVATLRGASASDDHMMQDELALVLMACS